MLLSKTISSVAPRRDADYTRSMYLSMASSRLHMSYRHAHFNMS
jgi:hypothetical protein